MRKEEMSQDREVVPEKWKEMGGRSGVRCQQKKEMEIIETKSWELSSFRFRLVSWVRWWNGTKRGWPAAMSRRFIIIVQRPSFSPTRRMTNCKTFSMDSRLIYNKHKAIRCGWKHPSPFGFWIVEYAQKHEMLSVLELSVYFVTF